MQSDQRQASLEDKIAHLEARAAQMDRIRSAFVSTKTADPQAGVSRALFDKSYEHLNLMVEDLLASLEKHV